MRVFRWRVVRIKFGIVIFPYLSLNATVSLCQEAEEQNFAYIWVGDEAPVPPNRDVFVTLSEIARKTRRIRIGPGTCNPYSRHPALIAVAVASLDEIAPGRTVLGIGPGGALLEPLCQRWDRPLTAVRETFTILRGMFAGDTVDLDGKVLRVKGAKLLPLPTEKMKIYLAARSPGMLTLAGELADGVLLTAPLGYVEYAVGRIRSGAEKAGRSLSEINIANILPFCLAKSREESRRLVRTEVAYVVSFTPQAALQECGIKLNDAERVGLALKQDIQKASEMVTDEMTDSFSIVGAERDCREKISEYRRAGVETILLCSPFGPDPREAIRIVGKEIAPSFA